MPIAASSVPVTPSAPSFPPPIVWVLFLVLVGLAGSREQWPAVAVLVVTAVVIAVFAVLRLDTTGDKGSGLSGAYTYDLRELAKVDPNLILYTQSGSAVFIYDNGSPY